MKKITILFLLLSQLSILAQDYKFGKVNKEELNHKFYPLDSTASAAYLLRKRKTYYSYNDSKGAFEVITEIHNRIKIYKKEGFRIATQNIYYYNPDTRDSERVSSIKGFVFNSNKGKIVKEKLSKNNIFKEKKNKFWSIRKITMPNIKEGSVIDIKYTVSSPYFYRITDLEFQFDIPVKKVDYSISIPEYYNFKTASKGYFFINPIRSHKIAFFSMNYKVRNEMRMNQTRFGNEKIQYKNIVTKYNAINIPALNDKEPFVSNINNYKSGISFELESTNFVSIGGVKKFYTKSWKDVSKQVYKLSSFGTELNKSSYYKNDVDNLLTNLNTDGEKAIAIFQFVKNNIKWNGYKGIYSDKGVRKAYKEKSGNVVEINLMLTSMLRYAGLNSDPVLVSSKENGVPLFPTIDGFDYVISMVKFLDGTYILLDATEPFSIPNMLPKRVLNWRGRVVTKSGESSWVRLNPSKHALKENKVIVKITESIEAEGLIITKYNNLNALEFRKKYFQIKEEDLITKLEEENKIDVENFKIGNKNKIWKPINRTVKFSSTELIEEINGKLYIEPLLFLSQKINPFKIEERKYPIDFTTPWIDKNTISIQLPKGYKVESLPETLAISLPEDLGVFKYQVSQVGKTIKTLSILQFNKSVVGPKYYSVLKDFYRQLVKKQSEKIVLIKEK